jgi:hypothetical protein
MASKRYLLELGRSFSTNTIAQSGAFRSLTERQRLLVVSLSLRNRAMKVKTDNPKPEERTVSSETLNQWQRIPPSAVSKLKRRKKLASRISDNAHKEPWAAASHGFNVAKDAVGGLSTKQPVRLEGLTPNGLGKAS